jgi:hypothetical protein
MDCIYLNCDHRGIGYCHAQPIRKGEAVVWYKPTDEELKNYCRNSEKFGSCPRYMAFEDYLESIGKSEREQKE